MSTVRALTSVLFAVLLGICARAQCPIQNDEDAPPKLGSASVLSAPGDEQLLPESGYLSDHRYTNIFFGFGLDLPMDSDGHRLMLRLMPPGQHALLGLAFENAGREGSIIIVASEPSNAQYKLTEAERREEFNRWAQSKPALHREMPDWMMRSGHIYHTEKKSGEMLTMQFSTRVKNYTIRTKVDSNDKEFSKRAKHLIEMMQFYCPQVDGTLTTDKGDPVVTQGVAYSGPTIPTWRVDARLAERPEQHAIPKGSVRDAVYRNPELGLTYTLPSGWESSEMEEPQSTAAMQISTRGAATNTRERVRQYLNACSATLVRAFPERPRGKADKEWNAEIILRALDPGCLSLRGPDSIPDRQGADELAGYLEMLGEFGKISSSDLVLVSGRVFAIYHGTIENRSDTKDLPSRATQMIFATRYNKLLFLWSLIVSTGSDLKSMPNMEVTFDGEAPVALGPALAEKSSQR